LECGRKGGTRGRKAELWQRGREKARQKRGSGAQGDRRVGTRNHGAKLGFRLRDLERSRKKHPVPGVEKLEMTRRGPSDRVNRSGLNEILWLLDPLLFQEVGAGGDKGGGGGRGPTKRGGVGWLVVDENRYIMDHTS